uniref:hypothetical protein n=1 Tax=Castellaniella defragrans TaxID=75697 RepID=UPI00334058F0
MKPENMKATESSWDDRLIRSPAELRAFMVKLKQAIASGEIQQYWPADAPFATEAKVSDVDENGPWPGDYIEWYFRSTTNKNRYKLAVETYHGHGGHWGFHES